MRLQGWKGHLTAIRQMWSFAYDICKVKVVKQVYSFAFEVPKGHEETVVDTRLSFFQSKKAAAEWVTTNRELRNEIEENDMSLIAEEFCDLCGILKSSGLLLRPGICFQFTFYTPEDVRGLHLPKPFLKQVARWDPSIDIPIWYAG